VFGIGVGIVAVATHTEAQNYPWCAYYSGSDDGGTHCGFTTLQQCMESARGMGSLCQPNTQYQPPPGSHRPKKTQERNPSG
jgi:Protein of unknown function (DUF3551)